MKTIYKSVIVTLVIVATMGLSVLLWNYCQEQGAKRDAEFKAEMAKRKAITKCVEERYNCKFIGGGVYETKRGERYFVENAESCLTFK